MDIAQTLLSLYCKNTDELKYFTACLPFTEKVTEKRIGCLVSSVLLLNLPTDIFAFTHSFIHSFSHSFGNVTVTAQAIFFNTALC